MMRSDSHASQCGEPSFSWIVRQGQFDTVHQLDTDQYTGVGRSQGEITGIDVDESGVFCTTCDERRRREALVPAAC